MDVSGLPHLRLSSLIAVILALLWVDAAEADVASGVRNIFYEGTIILDPEEAFDYREARRLARQRAGLPRQRVPTSGNVYWLVEDVRNTGGPANWSVEVFAARSDYIDLYVLDGERLAAHRRSGLIPKATEPEMLKGMGSHVLPLDLPAGQSRTLVLRIKSRSLINYSIKTGPESALNSTRIWRHFFVYMLMGGMLFLILYNLFLAFALRDLNYFLYVGYGFSYFVFFFNSYGFAATLLSLTNHPWITIYSGLSIEIFSIAFVWKFLAVKSWSRPLSGMMLTCLICLLGLSLAAPVLGAGLMGTVWMAAYLLIPVLVLYAAQRALALGMRQAIYVLVGWTPMLLGTLLAIAAMYGLVERPPSGAAINSTVVFEMLVLSLALADRVRQLRLERALAIRQREEKSSFLAMLSHEVRTPLNGILATIALLRQTKLTQRQKGYADNLGNAGSALMTLLDDVLDIAKAEAGKVTLAPAPVDLTGLVRSMCDLMATRATEKGIALRFETKGKIPDLVLADGARLRQVLLNLVSNAVKFTDRGEVWVRMIGADGPEGLADVRFEVRDTGIGISRNDLERLFLPFVQIDSQPSRRHEGTGLGLSISKELVEAMGGRLEVESAPGMGSLFHFRLQLEPAEAPVHAETKLPPVKGVRLLIVDDNALNRDALGELMVGLGYQVARAADGEAALRAVQDECPDAVILDVFMPGTDGRAVTRRLRALDNPPKIIGLTAAVDDKLIASCRAAGMDAVLTKPVADIALDAEIRALLGPDAAPLFYPAILDAYRQALGDDRILAEIDRFQDRWREGATHGKLSAAEAHRLAGMAATIGLVRLGRLLEDIAAHQRTRRDETVCAEAWSLLDACHDESFMALSAYRQALAAEA